MYFQCVYNLLRTLSIFNVLLSFVRPFLFWLHSFYWCPTLINTDRPSPAMASKNLKAKASLSPHVFFDDVDPEICIDIFCLLWCMTMAIFLEGFPRVQDPNQRYLLSPSFLCFWFFSDCCGSFADTSFSNLLLNGFLWFRSEAVNWMKLSWWNSESCCTRIRCHSCKVAEQATTSDVSLPGCLAAAKEQIDLEENVPKKAAKEQVLIDYCFRIFQLCLHLFFNTQLCLHLFLSLKKNLWTWFFLLISIHMFWIHKFRSHAAFISTFRLTCSCKSYKSLYNAVNILY